MPAANDVPMKPLIFCPRSVRAWQQGAKSQTRRLVKPQPLRGKIVYCQTCKLWIAQEKTEFELLDQPYAVGALLWIREALTRSDDDMVLYAADGVDCPDPSHPIDEVGLPQAIWTWKRRRLPAMFMPRWACRYYARVISVRPERLQDITDEDAVAEGVLVGWHFLSGTTWYHGKSRSLYWEWWDSLHRKPEHKSEANPVVWRYGLEKADVST